MVKHEDQGRLRPLAIALLALGAVGFVGFIAIVVASRVDTSLPLGWALGIGTFFGILMFGSPLLVGYVPDRAPVRYVPVDREGAPISSIPEFVPGEYTRSRVRRIAVVTLLWVTFGLWVTLYAIPVAMLLVVTFRDPDAQLDPTPYVLSLTWGTASLAAYATLRVFLLQLTTKGAHLRALRDALPEAYAYPNRTSASLSRMLKSIDPHLRARIDRTSYITVADGSLSVWIRTRGRLVRSVDVPLASITHVEYAVIDVAIIGLKGISVTSDDLTGPLELCPIEHIIDFEQSAAHLGRLLPPQGSPSGDRR